MSIVRPNNFMFLQQRIALGQKLCILIFESLTINSPNQSCFKFRRVHTNAYDLLHFDRVLVLRGSYIEALNETGEKEEDHLTSKNLSKTRTLS